MYLGLDLGTSGLKAVVLDADGQSIASASASYNVETPHANWSEQDPDIWIAACKAVFQTLHKENPKAVAGVKAISTSGQMHGAVALDASGKPLRPCILWNDGRSSKEASKLDRTENVRALSGNIVFPGFTAPKLMWMKNNEPDLFVNVDKVLLPKDYLLLWLTGEYVSDMSDAAGTSWLDVGARQWSAELLKAGEMRLDQLPKLVEGCDVIGGLRNEITDEYGFSKTVKVVAGGADNAISACGVGAVSEGQGFVSLGTSGVLLAARNSYSPAPETAVHSFCHALPNRWYQMGVILSATDSLNWLAKTLDTTSAELAGRLGAKVSGPSSVIFAPYLSGERTPHNDMSIGGAFLNLKTNTTSEEMCQAVMEGVCFALRDCLEALKKTGADLTEILAIGGGSNSDFWLQSLANILNLPLLVPQDGDYGAAFGAARLAMIGDGASIEATLSPPEIKRTIQPDNKIQAEYESAYQKFKRVYPLLKEL